MACSDQINNQDLENAKKDTVTLGEVATSRAGAVPTGESIDQSINRFGEASDTVIGRLKKMGYAVPVDYDGGIDFTENDNVKTIDESGVVYAPKPSSIPFTTSGTWGVPGVSGDNLNFFIVQGVTISELNAEIGKLNKETIAEWKSDGLAEEFDVVSIKERSAGNGGGGVGDVIAGTQSADGYRVIAHDTLNLSWVLRVDGGVTYARQWGAVSGALDSTKQVDAAIEYLESIGGGMLVFEAGDYAVSVSIAVGNIILWAAGAVTLRALGGANVVEHLATADNFQMLGGKWNIRGKTLANESVDNEGGTVNNTNALHCVAIKGTNARITNFTAGGARFDTLNVDADFPVNLIVEDYELLSSARNTFSVIQGQEITMKRGRLFIDNSNTTGSQSASGLYLFDQEPNDNSDEFFGITFEDTIFDNAGTSVDNWQIIFHEPHNSTGDHGVVMKRCKFIKSGASETPATIRINHGTERVFTGFEFENCDFENFMFAIAGSVNQTLEDSTLKNVTVGNAGFAFGVRIEDGCVLDNIDGPNGLRIPGADDAVTYLSNVKGHTRSRASSRFINVSDTSNFTDIVEVGTRGSFKITISGSDASSGSLGFHISESWIVVSNDTSRKPPVNVITNLAGVGLDVQWKDATSGIGVDRRTLQVKPQTTPANQYIVNVEVFSGDFSSAYVDWK